MLVAHAMIVMWYRQGMASDMDATLIEEALETAINPNLYRVLEVADEQGWSFNPCLSVVLRLAKPEDQLARPFFMRWDLAGRTSKGKPSWRFAGARAANGQALTIADALIYLTDTSVIYPEPPEQEETGKPEREGQ